MERLQSGDENLMYINCRDYKMKTLRSCETEQSCQVFWFCWGIFVGGGGGFSCTSGLENHAQPLAEMMQSPVLEEVHSVLFCRKKADQRYARKLKSFKMATFWL